MHDLTKHLFAFCAALLIAGGSINAVTSVPTSAYAQPTGAMIATELA